MRKMYLFFAILSFGLISCNKEDGVKKEITSQEASETINETVGTMRGDIISMIESDGLSSLQELLEKLVGSEGFNARMDQSDWTKERVQFIFNYFVQGAAARVSSDQPTVLEDISGLYVWNFETEDFDKTESDIFIVQFPGEGATTNNAELQITAFDTISIADEDLPILIEGQLTLDTEVVMSLNLEADWSPDGMPLKADVDLLISPFTFTVKFDDTFDKASSLLSSIHLEEESILGIDAEVKYQNITKDDPYLIAGNVSYRQLKIAGDADMREIGLDGNPNDFIDLEILLGDDKIGDVVFILDEVIGDYVPYIQYADGTTELLDDVLEPIFIEIEDMLEFLNEE